MTWLVHSYFLARGCLENAATLRTERSAEEQLAALSLGPQPSRTAQGTAHLAGCPSPPWAPEEKAWWCCCLGQARVHWNCLPGQSCWRELSQVLFQRSGNSIKRHLSGTESSLWICAFWHFHLHLLKQTHHQHLLVLLWLGPSPFQIMKGSSGKIMIFFFLHVTACDLQKAEFWQKHKINWILSKPFFGFQDPLINLRWKFFSLTEAQERNDALWFFTFSCNWGGTFLLIHSHWINGFINLLM